MNGRLRTNQIIAVSPRYAGTFSGGPRQRDAVYDEGADWMWLLGTVALARYPVYSDVARAQGGFPARCRQGFLIDESGGRWRRRL